MTPQQRGLHSTHPFIRRSYIQRWGGTFDWTGIVFCELYDHQFVDDEFTQTAQARRQWAFAGKSHVEHIHPLFSDQKMDATYRKALKHSDRDGLLYRQRLKEMRAHVPRERLAKAQGK